MARKSGRMTHARVPGFTGTIKYESGMTVEYEEKEMEWGLALDRIVDETQKEYMKRSRQVDRDLLGFLIGDYEGELGTPVKTGRAFSSWRLMYNQPYFVDTGGPYFYSKHDHYKSESSMLKYKTKLSDETYITNGAPYINILNLGHSSQNAYFIEKAIARTKAKNM